MFLIEQVDLLDKEHLAAEVLLAFLSDGLTQLVVERDRRGDGHAHYILVFLGNILKGSCHLGKKVELVALGHGIEHGDDLGAGASQALDHLEVLEHMVLGLGGFQKGARVGLEHLVLIAASRHSGYLLPGCSAR